MQIPENNRILVRISHDEETALRSGNEMMVQGRFEEAVQHYDRAIEIRPDSAMAWHSRANALEALGNYNEALACYDAALDCDAGDAECWFNKGVTLRKLGRNKDGAACIETGVHIATGKK
jgi:tetratricopeptide (TPR) repeat protein